MLGRGNVLAVCIAAPFYYFEVSRSFHTSLFRELFSPRARFQRRSTLSSFARKIISPWQICATCHRGSFPQRTAGSGLNNAEKIGRNYGRRGPSAGLNAITPRFSAKHNEPPLFVDTPKNAPLLNTCQRNRNSYEGSVIRGCD